MVNVGDGDFNGGGDGDFIGEFTRHQWKISEEIDDLIENGIFRM